MFESRKNPNVPPSAVKCVNGDLDMPLQRQAVTEFLALGDMFFCACEKQ